VTTENHSNVRREVGFKKAELQRRTNPHFPGKNAIELSSKEGSEPTLQSIKKAVDNGEFDKLSEKQLTYGSHQTKVN
jgi:hypothetical protein